MIEVGGRAGDAPTTRISRAERLDRLVIRLLDVVLAVTLSLVLALLICVLAAAVRLESRGPAFYRSRRVGVGGREFEMLKFRKMPEGAGGSLLTAPEDDRFTRLGRFLARTKLDELPQLWNVIKGEMSLVGPRPEAPLFVERFRDQLEAVLSVRPGITGLSQLAFAREPEILDPQNREGHYLERILPQKIHLDTVYVVRRSAGLNLQILLWTAVAVLFRRDVAVHRKTGGLGLRRRPKLEPSTAEPAPLELSSLPLEQTGS